MVPHGLLPYQPRALRAVAGSTPFICEDYFFDKKIKSHTDYATLVRHRPELGCRRLALTHMADVMPAMMQHLEAETAEEGKRVVL